MRMYRHNCGLSGKVKLVNDVSQETAGDAVSAPPASDRARNREQMS
jgi:hypothetical protein